MMKATQERVSLTRALESPARVAIRAMDVAANRVYGWQWNPVHQSGVLAVWLLIVLTVTGLYLLLFYRVGSPSQSVANLAASPWLGGWVRSVHRYATDLFVVAAVLHALRFFAQARSWGPRTRAWVTGVFLVGVGLVCAWTGFIMAWDSFGQRLAMAGAALFDALPILSEPVARVFAGDRPIPGAFFFINMFAHIALPLAMGAGLWLHVSRVARPVLSPPRRIRWWVTVGLVAMAVLVPAPLGPAADPFVLPSATPLNLLSSAWVPVAERVPPWASWTLMLALVTAVASIPRFARRPREGSWTPSHADPRHCTGCNQCPQDCPWEAITMVPRDDGRPSLLAHVDPALCVSCGICAGSCAPMGVGPPAITGREQLARLRSEIVPRIAGRPAPLVVICCGQAPASVRARLAHEGALVHEVSCVGNLHSSVIELSLRNGAAGVLVAGCPPRDCVGREGPKWLDQRLYHDREAELQPRVDRRRLHVTTFAHGCDAESMAAFATFRSAVEALESPAADTRGDIDLECEPAPAAAEGA